MKYIFTLSLFFFFCLVPVFANEDITVSLSQERAQVGEEVELQIEFSSQKVGEQELQIEIPGIEKFEVFSQAQSLNFQSINGLTQSILSYTLSFSAPDPGMYTLGPVKLGSGTGENIDDTTLTLQVIEAGKNPHQPTTTGVPSPSDISENPGEEIRGLRDNTSLFWFFIFATITFSGIGYVILSKILEKKSQTHVNNTPNISPEREEFGDVHFFQELAEHIGQMNTSEFFQAFNGRVREIFSRTSGDFTHSATLEELKQEKNILSHPCFSLFQKSYIAEYNLKEYSHAEKQIYIDDILKLL